MQEQKNKQRSIEKDKEYKKKTRNQRGGEVKNGKEEEK